MTLSEKELFGAVSIIPGIIGFGSYIWAVFAKNTKPHIFSWLIWSLMGGVVFAVQYAEGAGAGAWTIGFGFLACLTVAVIALFRGERHITLNDKIALAGGVATILLWYFTKAALPSVILASIVDAFAFYPTARKSWLKPYEKSAPVYILDSGRFALSLFSMENYSAAVVLYPLLIIFMNMTFVIVLFYRRHRLGR